ncbi:MAG: hypothetical protein J6B04_04485 [Clostridia bacterium]|nr:hypothetical protein [Clostridia bacterium]
MYLRSLINRYKNLSYSSLENEAGANYKKLLEHMLTITDREKVNTLLIGSIFTSVAVNGKFSDKEWQFVSSFIGGYTYDSAFDVASEFYNAEAQDIVCKLYRSFPADVAEAFLRLCVAVLCVDGNVDDKEMTFLKQITG